MPNITLSLDDSEAAFLLKNIVDELEDYYNGGQRPEPRSLYLHLPLDQFDDFDDGENYVSRLQRLGKKIEQCLVLALGKERIEDMGL